MNELLAAAKAYVEARLHYRERDFSSKAHDADGRAFEELERAVAATPAPEVPADRAALANHVRRRIDAAADVMSRVMSSFDLEQYAHDFERSLAGLRALQANDAAPSKASEPASVANPLADPEIDWHLQEAFREGVAYGKKLAAAPEAPGTQDGEALEEAMQLAQEFGDAMLKRGILSSTTDAKGYAKSFDDAHARKSALRALLTPHLRSVAPEAPAQPDYSELLSIAGDIVAAGHLNVEDLARLRGHLDAARTTKPEA